MKSFRLAAIFLLSIAAVSAQEVRKIAFRTLTLEPLPGLNELQLPPATPKGKSVTATLYVAALSPVVEGEFKGDEAVFVVKAGDATKPVAKGKLAKSKRQVLLFQPVKNEQGESSYEIHAFDDDLDVFKLGSIRVINLSPKEVRFTMGGKELPPLPAGDNVIYPRVKAVDEYEMYQVNLEAKVEGTEWTKVYAASWKASDQRREIALVTYDDRFKQLAVKLMSDDPPWVKAK
ncbi:hypothetical protein [Luteolibacter soli]|uniref:DUF4397 domain-containing protein n=1 Tax=Luteolibacter soli TaxID=3135280 RepID=A0ABU9B1C4_9BACT